MPNIIDYAESVTQSFEEKALGDVDSLIFSTLAYAELYEGTIEDIAGGNLDTVFSDTMLAKKNRRLLLAAAKNPRFALVRVHSFVNAADENEQKQFCAMLFEARDFVYVAYRGTDSTFLGWREDFNLAFITPIPSQRSGVEYLNAAAGKTAKPLFVGGHSKGGNIAVYSAIKCNAEVQRRLERVFTHDGPGFREDMFELPEYKAIEKRIEKTMPQSALVGMLMHCLKNYRVVRSTGIDVLQHDPFTWVVENGEFALEKELSVAAEVRNSAINGWINTLSDEERERFTDALYGAIKATGAKTTRELAENWPQKAKAAMQAVASFDEDTRKILFESIGAVFTLAIKNIKTQR
ncbi:MAG: DUF2974 domain-containing protein [Clostridia bacterium]|nr:DUF2974 domain-containing protein [Clostridia bacterium]